MTILHSERFGLLVTHLMLVANAHAWPKERFDLELTRAVRNLARRLSRNARPVREVPA